MSSKSSHDKNNKVHESIGHRISILYRFTKIYIDRELAEFGIGSGQIPFLMTLYRGDGVSQEVLTEIHNVDKATTTRAINKLEVEGYVVRKVDETDRRAYRVHITDKGWKMKPVFHRKLQRWTKILLNDFSESDRVTLLKLLDRLADNASEYNE